MSKDSIKLRWKEPVEFLAYLSQQARSGPGAHAVRLAALVLAIAIPLGLGMREFNFWFLIMPCFATIWLLRGRLLLQKLGFDTCERIELSEKWLTCSSSLGISWMPVSRVAEYSIFTWKLESYSGHELVLKTRRGWVIARAGIPEGFDLVPLLELLDRLGLKRTTPASGRIVPPPLRPHS